MNLDDYKLEGLTEEDRNALSKAIKDTAVNPEPEKRDAFVRELIAAKEAKLHNDNVLIHTGGDRYESANDVIRQRDECLAALKAWEYARKEGGISMVDWFEVAWKKTQAAIANAEAAPKRPTSEPTQMVRCPDHRSGGATSCPRGGAELQIWQRRQWGD